MADLILGPKSNVTTVSFKDWLFIIFKNYWHSKRACL